MFEQYTEDVILNSMLDKIPNNLDKREGSLIYNALAPASIEVARMYSDMDRFLTYAFANIDMPSEYLDLKVSEYGLKRKPATNCIKKGLFYGQGNTPIDITLGNRFGIDGYNFIATEKISIGNYKMKCETVGKGSNYITGSLTPIEYIEGLSVATLGDTLVYGEDAESNESLLNRLDIKIKAPSTSGNVYHYRMWALEVIGVGECRIKPLWNGPGSVKVILIDNNKRTPGQEVINSVKANIEEKRPIGADVTVVGASEVVVNVSVNISIDNSETIEVIKQQIIKNIGEYIKSIAFKDSVIRYTRIANCILDAKGVIDYSNLTVNAGTSNIPITDEQIAVVGSVVITNA